MFVRKRKSASRTETRMSKIPLDVKSYPLKIGLQKEKEPDAIIEDEYQKGAHGA